MGEAGTGATLTMAAVARRTASRFNNRAIAARPATASIRRTPAVSVAAVRRDWARTQHVRNGAQVNSHPIQRHAEKEISHARRARTRRDGRVRHNEDGVQLPRSLRVRAAAQLERNPGHLTVGRARAFAASIGGIPVGAWLAEVACARSAGLWTNLDGADQGAVLVAKQGHGTAVDRGVARLGPGHHGRIPVHGSSNCGLHSCQLGCG